MKIRVDAKNFSARRNELSFRFCCEDCVHFHTDPDRCAHGWPTADHRLSRYAQPSYTEVVFCKEFELA